MGLAVTTAAAVTGMALGGSGMRIGAAFGLAAVYVPLIAAARSVRGARGLTWPGALSRTLHEVGGGFILGVAVYFVVIVMNELLPQAADLPDWSRTGIGLVAATAAITSLTVAAVSARRVEGVERYVFGEATSASFFVTMGAALAYALLEVTAGAPTISMWAVWTVGMLSWVATSVVVSRRVT